MYGTVATFKIKPGSEEKLLALQDQWWDDRGKTIKGAISGTVFRLDSDPNSFVMAVLFDSKENYVANANDPEQDKWYREIAQYFDGEPTWMDGEVVSHKAS